MHRRHGHLEEFSDERLRKPEVFRLKTALDAGSPVLRLIEDDFSPRFWFVGSHNRGLLEAPQRVWTICPYPLARAKCSHTERSEERRVGKDCRDRWSSYH